MSAARMSATHVAAALHRATVQLATSRAGSGSGVLWPERGVVITNAHVARGSGARVAFWDGRSVEARLIARDERADLAALTLEPGPVPAGVQPIRTRDPATLRVGELVIALGAPWGVPGAASLGVLHAPPFTARRGSQAVELLTADVRLAPGNSGGPLADAEGRLIGINAMIVGGLAVAISIATVERFVAALEPLRAAS